MTPLQLQGIGMTSQRTRDRLITRLMGKGIKNREVLEVLPGVGRKTANVVLNTAFGWLKDNKSRHHLRLAA